MDTCLDHRFPINQTTYKILSWIDNETTVEEVIEKVKKSYKIDNKSASHDVIDLLESLYENNLINIKKFAIKSRTKLSYFYLKTLNLKGLINIAKFQKRYDLPLNKRKPVTLFGYFLLIIIYVHIFWLSAFVFLLYFTTLFSLQEIILLNLSFILSSTIHEYAHVLGLYTVRRIDCLGYFKRTFFTIGVTRETLSPKKEIVVSLMGPIVPTVIGVILIVLSSIYSNGFLFILAFPWIINIFALLFTDGKSIFKALNELYFNKNIFSR